jgi:hypothetical protein
MFLCHFFVRSSFPFQSFDTKMETSPEPIVYDTVSPMTNTSPTPKHTSKLDYDDEEGEDVVCFYQY